MFALAFMNKNAFLLNTKSSYLQVFEVLLNWSTAPPDRESDEDVKQRSSVHLLPHRSFRAEVRTFVSIAIQAILIVRLHVRLISDCIWFRFVSLKLVCPCMHQSAEGKVEAFRAKLLVFEPFFSIRSCVVYGTGQYVVVVSLSRRFLIYLMLPNQPLEILNQFAQYGHRHIAWGGTFY